MTTSSCIEFLDRAENDPEVVIKTRATTDLAELLALGRRLGYTYADDEFVRALTERASDEGTERDEPIHPSDGGGTRVLHYEVMLTDVAELAPVVAELPHLTIAPDGVDLDEFGRSFRADDMAWTAMSPASPGFAARYEEIMRPHWTGADTERRDFHLVNLDQMIHHSGYAAYFDAKVRTIRHLEAVLGPDVRFSGSLWYPPFSYRLWHTNETQPGWRMYLIDLDSGSPEDDETTYFRYMDPVSKELVTLPDRPKMLRFFQIRQEPENLLWHCIVNRGARNRWSFGFAVPDDWAERLGATALPGTSRLVTG